MPTFYDGILDHSLHRTLNIGSVESVKSVSKKYSDVITGLSC